jgi:hypothetical protein
MTGLTAVVPYLHDPAKVATLQSALTRDVATFNQVDEVFNLLVNNTLLIFHAFSSVRGCQQGSQTMMCLVIQCGQDVIILWVQTGSFVPFSTRIARAYSPDFLDLEWVAAYNPIRSDSHQWSCNTSGYRTLYTCRGPLTILIANVGQLCTKPSRNDMSQQPCVGPPSNCRTWDVSQSSPIYKAINCEIYCNCSQKNRNCGHGEQETFNHSTMSVKRLRRRRKLRKCGSQRKQILETGISRVSIK